MIFQNDWLNFMKIIALKIKTREREFRPQTHIQFSYFYDISILKKSSKHAFATKNNCYNLATVQTVIQ